MATADEQREQAAEKRNARMRRLVSDEIEDGDLTHEGTKRVVDVEEYRE